MKLKHTRIWLGVAILLGSAAAGFAWVRPFAPAQLRGELEVRLGELVDGEVRIPELRLSLGWGLQLIGTDIEAWPGQGGQAQAALRIDRVTAELRPFAALTGQRQLRLLRIEGATLRVARHAGGGWTPAPADSLFQRGTEASDAQPDEWLQPLVALETLAHRVLGGSLAADIMELQGGTLLLEDARAAPGSLLRSASIHGLRGSLHRRWWNDTQLRLRGTLRGGDAEVCSFELVSDRDREGGLGIGFALDDFDLQTLAPWLGELSPDSRLSGRLRGAANFATRRPGHGRLELDLVATDLESRVASSQSGEARPARRQIPRAELRGELEITPEQVHVEGLRVFTEPFSLEFDGSLGRPLRADSPSQLAVVVQNASLTHLRHLIGWLPAIRREDAEGIVSPLEHGDVTLLRVGGAHSVSGWQRFLTGRTDRLPRDFVVDARLAETTLRVGDAERLEQLEGRLWWTGDRLEIRGATALLNGNPLPRLDLSLDGVQHLFTTQPAARRRQPGAQDLPGLRTLWDALAGEPGEEPARVERLVLEVERLDHPIFVWPLEGLTARLEPIAGGLHIETAGGTLAGAPLSGELQWLVQPEPAVSARLHLDAPVAREPVLLPPGHWLAARFESGQLEAGSWQHRSARGSLRAQGAAIEIADAEIALAPRGQASGRAHFDLSSGAAVPFELEFDVQEGDVQALGTVVGLPAELATGQLRTSGSLSGKLGGGPVEATLSGQVQLDARDGRISRSVPAVMAVAMASDMVNPFARKEQVRYDRIASQIEIEDGKLRSEELTLEGPDLRAVASGGVDLADPAHPLDVEVVLFLLRPVDVVLEKIPVVNYILLGGDQNLVAAHFDLVGPWNDPESNMIPHRSFTHGAGSLVFERFPSLVRRGFEALDSLFSRGGAADHEADSPLPATGG